MINTSPQPRPIEKKRPLLGRTSASREATSNKRPRSAWLRPVRRRRTLELFRPPLARPAPPGRTRTFVPRLQRRLTLDRAPTHRRPCSSNTSSCTAATTGAPMGLTCTVMPLLASSTYLAPTRTSSTRITTIITINSYINSHSHSNNSTSSSSTNRSIMGRRSRRPPISTRPPTQP